MAEQRFTTASSRNRKIAKAHKERRDRRGSESGLIRAIMVVGLIAVFGVPSYYWIQNAEFGSSVAELLRVADLRYVEGKMDQSLELMEKAEQHQPSTEQLMAIATLRRRVANTRSMQADLQDLGRAGRSLVILDRFESQYLQSDPQRREACRELIKLIDAWQGNYQEVCSRHADKSEYQDLLDRVSKLDEKYRVPADLTKPDTAQDVLFAAARPTRLNLRRYKKAVGILNSWLKANRGDRRESEVLEQRNQYHQDCDNWVSDKIVSTRRMVTNGNLDRALDEMRVVVAECALPGSIDSARQRLRELEKLAAEAK